MRRLRKLQTGDRALSMLQDNIDWVLQQIVDLQFLVGVELTAGAVNRVQHRLGRRPVGWFVVRKRSQGDVWDAQDYETSPETSLSLWSSANVVVDLMVL